jgi:hypothetical protein
VIVGKLKVWAEGRVSLWQRHPAFGMEYIGGANESSEIARSVAPPVGKDYAGLRIHRQLMENAQPWQRSNRDIRLVAL